MSATRRWAIFAPAHFLLMAALLWALPSFAQGAPQRQYVIALDDSGSMGAEDWSAMRNARYGNIPVNDPHRLSRFAARLFIDALPAEASAALLTMTHSEPGEGGLPGLALLTPNHRARLVGLLNAPREASGRGLLTRYDEASTPCDKVLRGLQKTLNSAWHPGVTQSAVFLSDGVCTGNFGERQVREFLRGLNSEQSIGARSEESKRAGSVRPFQFHFICMGGNCSSSLRGLAEETGGATFDIPEAANDPDPGRLVGVFGEILGRSMNVCPTAVTGRELPEFLGATSVSVVSVAPSGETLDRAQSWSALGLDVQESRDGDHYGGGTQRFSYRTGVAGISARTLNESVRGRLLAIPIFNELRLQVRLLKVSGEECPTGNYDANADTIQPSGGTSPGTKVCVEAVVMNGDRPVGRNALNRSVEVKFRRNAEGSESTMAPAARTTQLRYVFGPEPVRDEWNVRAEAVLASGCSGVIVGGSAQGGEVRLQGAFSAVAREVEFKAELARNDVGIVRPGESARVSVKFSGAFAEGPVELKQLSSRTCAVVRTADGGTSFSGVVAGVSREFQLDVSRECPDLGPQPKRVEMILQHVETKSEVPLTLRYVAQAYDVPSLFPSSVEVVPAGPVVSLQSTVGLGQGHDHVHVEILNERSNPSLPTSLLRPWGGEMLHLGLGDKRDGQVAPNSLARKASGRALELTLPARPGEALPVELRVRAQGCCTAGEYRVPVRVTLIREGHRVTSETQTLVVTVVPASAWTVFVKCWLCPLLLLLLALFTSWLAWMSRRLWRNTHVLDLDDKKQAFGTKKLIYYERAGSGRVDANDDVDRILRDYSKKKPGSWWNRKFRLMCEAGLRGASKPWFETYRLVVNEDDCDLQLLDDGYIKQGCGKPLTQLPAGVYLRAKVNGGWEIFLNSGEDPRWEAFPDLDSVSQSMRRKVSTRSRRNDDAEAPTQGIVSESLAGKYVISVRDRAPKHDEPVGFQVVQGGRA